MSGDGRMTVQQTVASLQKLLDSLPPDGHRVNLSGETVQEILDYIAAMREFIQIVADNSYASGRDLVESARALLEGSEG